MRRRTALFALLVAAPSAYCCGMVFRGGGGNSVAPVVAVASETAVITYDPETKTEHFVRRGTFAGTSADFGFLVPTPSVPELSEADERLFRDLELRTAPRHVYETKVITEYGFGPGGCAMLPGQEARGTFANVGSAVEAMPMAPAARVDVLKEQKVGAYDAAVLKANDAEKLNKWLTDHGYATRPELDAWLKWYTDNKWIITAFKIAGSNPQSITSTTVRMSFKTEKPFYPYREPADSRGPSAAPNRLLRVYFLGDKQYAGTVGKDTPWPGTAVWADKNPIPAAWVAGHFKLKELEKVAFEKTDWTLTEFEDRSSPRPGTDELYFSPAADQSPKERPPIVHTTYEKRYVPGPVGGWILFGAFVLIGSLGILLLFRRLLRAYRNPA